MADNRKHHKHEREHKNEQVELGEEDKWNPTPEAFEAFQVRDNELALRNVEMIMRSRNVPVTLKELKDSTLHSASTVESAIATHMAVGFVVENNGRFSIRDRGHRP